MNKDCVDQLNIKYGYKIDPDTIEKLIHMNESLYYDLLGVMVKHNEVLELSFKRKFIKYEYVIKFRNEKKKILSEINLPKNISLDYVHDGIKKKLDIEDLMNVIVGYY